MSKDELLVLRKTLIDLLDKGFIRVSYSPTAAPVLFVRGSVGVFDCNALSISAIDIANS